MNKNQRYKLLVRILREKTNVTHSVQISPNDDNLDLTVTSTIEIGGYKIFTDSTTIKANKD